MIEDNEVAIHGLIGAIEDRGWSYDVTPFSYAEQK